MNVLLGVTGSVAAKLTPRLVEGLGVHGLNVKLVATEKSLVFWNSIEVLAPIYRDKDEWTDYQTGQPVLHIDLRKWADLLLIAPLTANTLAKMACGLADNLLTSVIRAWDANKPVVIAPAMNTQMWEKSITHRQLTEIRYQLPLLHLVMPVSKVLACGEEGMGAMAPIQTIVEAVLKEKCNVHSDRS